jgi:hypothetical protein
MNDYITKVKQLLEVAASKASTWWIKSSSAVTLS